MAKLLQWFKTKSADDASIESSRAYLLTFVQAQMFSNTLFEGVSWYYLLSDLDLMARAAKLTPLANRSVASVCSVIDTLPPASVEQLMAGRFAYFTPPSDDNDGQVAELLFPLSPAIAKEMLLRRKAVHLELEVNDQRKAVLSEQAAERQKLISQWYKCPSAKLSNEPDDLLHWVRVQTPDTWHELILSWGYNNGGALNDVLGWIVDQPNCDLSTAATFFFNCAIGLASEDPSSLSPWYHSDWEMMKRVADNWNRGLYTSAELRLDVEASDIKYYDDLVVQRNNCGRPLAWNIPEPQFRRFGARAHVSAYHFEDGRYLSLSFETWLRRRDRPSMCGLNYPACCGSSDKRVSG
jgi:hypothetical protein